MTVTPDELARAVAALRADQLVAFPTETVYGLGADASSPDALARLFAVKQRPADHPVIVHLPEGGALDAWAVDVPESARRLAAAFWPGPLTLVLRRADGVLDAITGGQDTVGVRVPDQPVALELLREFGGGIAAPSANRFGRVSPTTADDVRADLGDDVTVLLDGGPCRVGVESTIVSYAGPAARILRLGGIGWGDVERVLGTGVVHPRDTSTGRESPRVPGTLPSHYAPHARVELEADDELETRVAREVARGLRVGVIVPWPLAPAIEGAFVLGRPSDDAEYARTLYRMLRAADERALDLVIAAPPSDTRGIGAAVTDRLRRAAAPRPPQGADGT